MQNSTGTVSDKQKELCALTSIRRLVELYSDTNGFKYDEAFYGFAVSDTYKAIFDFKSGLWRESAVYLLSIYNDELERKNIRQDNLKSKRSICTSI